LRPNDWLEDRELWRNGERHAPLQPALTRTCREIRRIALKIYYQDNTFYAHYCFQARLEPALAWLRKIGPDRLRQLRNLYFIDDNPQHDENVPEDLAKVKQWLLLNAPGSYLESLSTDLFIKHRVHFHAVDWKREGCQAR